MVLMEYLQRNALCSQNADPLKKMPLPASIPPSSYANDLYPTKAPKPAPQQPSSWPLFGTAARVLKGGADLVNSAAAHLRDGLSEEDRLRIQRTEERRQILSLRMKNAETADQWKAAARDLDDLEGNESWKHDPDSPDFDAVLVEARLKQLDKARTDCDTKAMLNLVRTSLSRDLAGMGNIKLYKHSYIGTKDLIERYIDSTIATIRALVETSKHSLPDGLETKDILEQVLYARQAFGRSALLLSGGATFGMNHVGVLKALFEAKLLPRIISGASAGSIVCAVLCTRTDEEIPDVLKSFPYGDLSVFEDSAREDGILERVHRLLTQGAWIDIKHLTRVMQELLGDMTFQEGYNRTRRILNICVSSASVYELPRLLNYVTSPNVMIWSAVAASCSVPFLFSAAQLLVKNPTTGENSPWNPTPQRWIDGSVDNDLPMTRLAEMFNVNHFIVSQVNPHVIPFLAKDDKAITRDAQSDSSTGPGWIYTLTNLAKDEALFRMQVLAELGIFPNLVTKARSVLSQKYSGDITILPEIEYKDFPRMLKNPTAEFMVQTCLSGERATWPKLSRIRNHCSVELELDAAVQQLRARVVFSPSQVDLRRMTTGSLRGTGKRIGRRRRESSSNVQALKKAIEAADNGSPANKIKAPKPLLRSSSTYQGVNRRQPQPLTSQTGPTTPIEGTSQLSQLFERPSPSKRNAFQLNLQIPDMSSAGETTQSPRSSDADIDSHTDESSPELDLSLNGTGLGIGDDDEVDFFSVNQPVTPRSDHVLATAPSASLSPVLSRSNLALHSERLKMSVPSGPESRYKKLFHRS
ncbi:patatin-like phospholipase-containing protein [Coleophoma crateriformis]|uniref:Patatin-like phospholipase domain-containing protein n=1 Tax=Coleophoma crateriformis TaxID=565419 RepID=A0A3D8SM45_9HELO|nr:patatin-like phospholipase-containing protein [Coleophoma crateriformis]